MKTFTIVTPENVDFRYQLAGPARRGLAWGLDQLLVLTLIAGLLFPANLLFPVLKEFSLAIRFLVYFVISTLYPIVFEMRDGQTPGKKALHIRVFSDRGTPASATEVAIRNVIRAVDVLPFLYLLGGVTAWARRDGRRLGDCAAGTIVVEELPLLPPSALRPADSGRYNTFLEDPTLLGLAHRRLTPEDREGLLELCLRRQFLEERARLRLFAQYARSLRRKLDRAELDDIADERLVVNCVEALLRGRRWTSGRKV